MDLKHLRTADAYSCGLATAPSKNKCFNARLGGFAAKTFKTRDVAGRYYETIV